MKNNHWDNYREFLESNKYKEWKKQHDLQIRIFNENYIKNFDAFFANYEAYQKHKSSLSKPNSSYSHILTEEEQSKLYIKRLKAAKWIQMGLNNYHLSI